MAKKEVILIIGAHGQIGTELTVALREKYGREAVIAADLADSSPARQIDGPYVRLNVMDKMAIEDVVSRNKVTIIYHLAAVLSANGEKNPPHTWTINMLGLLNVLDMAKIFGLRIFWPSSIAVFGPNSPKVLCPQNAVMEPATVYGITKHAGEQLCKYYHRNYGIDVRSLRFPGLISYTAKAGGGTTDYAVDIFHKAVEKEHYTCFLKAKTRLPMMYMPDAIRAVLQLMDMPAEQLKTRMAYNISAMSFTPEELYQEIRGHLPGFSILYNPDSRQVIADSWPESIDDAAAISDWGWQPTYDLAAMTTDMLENITKMKLTSIK